MSASGAVPRADLARASSAVSPCRVLRCDCLMFTELSWPLLLIGKHARRRPTRVGANAGRAGSPARRSTPCWLVAGTVWSRALMGSAGSPHVVVGAGDAGRAAYACPRPSPDVPWAMSSCPGRSWQSATRRVRRRELRRRSRGLVGSDVLRHFGAISGSTSTRARACGRTREAPNASRERHHPPTQGALGSEALASESRRSVRNVIDQRSPVTGGIECCQDQRASPASR